MRPETEGKSQIRARMRALRQGLSPREVREAGSAVLRLAVMREETRSARSVCAYVSVGNEVDTLPLLARFLEEGKRLFIPDWEGWRAWSGIHVLRVLSLEDLRDRGSGVPQPPSDPGGRASPEGMDLFLVPGLAFDRQGHRLGMGGGFYDRMLSLAAPRARFLGLAYDFQLVDRLPHEAHDVPVHGVVHPALAGGLFHGVRP